MLQKELPSSQKHKSVDSWEMKSKYPWYLINAMNGSGAV